jgi:acyl-CoA synthetase (AMP-forming)/AMP-acid ligase II
MSTVASLMDVLRNRAADQPQREAFGWWGERGIESSITYGALDDKARAIGATLQAKAAPRARALLLYPPGFDYVAAFFGCLYGNVIAVPAYPPDPTRLDRTLPRLRAIISDAQATVVLTSSAILSFVAPVLAHAPELAALTWIATDPLTDASGWSPPTLAGDDLAFLQYTSGSTGDPKGVMLSHFNLLENAEVIRRAHDYGEHTRMVAWVPPYHDMGLIGSIIQPVYSGFSCTLMSPMTFLRKPLTWLQAITQKRATSSGAPNFAYDLCARKVTAEQRKKLDLSTWDIAYCGSEQVRKDTLDRFTRTFASCGFRRSAFYPCYGLAEAIGRARLLESSRGVDADIRRSHRRGGRRVATHRRSRPAPPRRGVRHRQAQGTDYRARAEALPVRCRGDDRANAVGHAALPPRWQRCVFCRGCE